MLHLTEDEIMLLAETTEEQLVYTNGQLEMLEHLKTCPTCYEKFCGALALLEVTSDSGYVVLSELYGMEYAKSLAAHAENKVLAVVSLVRNKIMDRMDVVLEQVTQTGDAFRFQPALSMAARGVSGSGSAVYKLEDINDEKTFIAVDPKENVLLLQVNARELDGAEITAVLLTETGEQIEIPLEKKGKLYKGRINSLPDGEFRIVIHQSK